MGGGEWMLTGTVNRLQGQVRIRVESLFPERILNLCSIRGLAFWDLEWETEKVFTCRLTRQDFKSLQKATKNLDCAISVVRREGVPYFLLRFRHRQALMIGLVGCGFLLLLGSFFIWDFKITGNETVPEERILRALEERGIGIGTFGLSLDGEDLRNHILLELPELSWIAVNVSGCRANVQVRERVIPPELVRDKEPANVVARRPGLILEIHALDGVKSVLPGTAVTRGQLLISGVEDLDTVGARVLAGLGSVKARTWYSLTTTIPLTAQEKEYTGKEKTGISLVIGKQRLKFFPNSSHSEAKYDKITNNYSVSVLGIPLPVKLCVETLSFYETSPVKLDLLRAEQLGEQILTEQLQTFVEPYGTISSTLCSTCQKGDALEVTLAAECVEEIGKTVPILTEELGKPLH